MISTAIAFIRTQIYFILWFLPYTMLWSTLAALTAWALPKKYQYVYIVLGWSWPLILGAKWIVGIDFEVRGRENIPKAAVVVCNHQSTWESMFMLVLFAPQVTVLKKSLINIPFFGWALKVIDPIAIDRSNPRSAAKAVIDEGKKRLLAGSPYLLIYPEGTRNEPGNLKKFSRGGAVLAKQTDLPLLPVSQNSGAFWKLNKNAYFSGKIIVQIHPAIDCSELTAPEAMLQAHQTIKENLNILPMTHGKNP